VQKDDETCPTYSLQWKEVQVKLLSIKKFSPMLIVNTNLTRSDQWFSISLYFLQFDESFLSAVLLLRFISRNSLFRPKDHLFT